MENIERINKNIEQPYLKHRETCKKQIKNSTTSTKQTKENKQEIRNT